MVGVSGKMGKRRSSINRNKESSGNNEVKVNDLKFVN
jgi:hypothetical protein